MERWGKMENVSEINLSVTLFHVNMFIKKSCAFIQFTASQRKLFFWRKKKCAISCELW